MFSRSLSAVPSPHAPFCPDVHSLVLIVVAAAALVQPQPAFAQRSRAAAPSIADVMPAANIEVDPMLQQPIAALLARSPTFRRQWAQVASTQTIRVRIATSAELREMPSARARSEVSRYAYGAIRALVEVPAVVDVTELLPHEFEHILEQLEGLDLPRCASAS